MIPTLSQLEEELGFSLELVSEGGVRLVVPKLSEYVVDGSYVPSRAPVFYNPLMALCRDVGVALAETLSAFGLQKLLVCEPLTGAGARGIRYCVEAENVEQAVLGDINPRAVRLAEVNASINSASATVVREEANSLMARMPKAFGRPHLVDVDPFGSPATFVENAIRCLSNGGVIALTATDLAPLCGVYPKACRRKYGAWSLRTEYCHELAIRILMGFVCQTAARLERGVVALYCHSTAHYVRVYMRVFRGAKRADSSLENLAYIIHCFKCLHREVSKDPHPPLTCSSCGSRVGVAGPLWAGPLFEKKLCEKLVEVGKELPLAKKQEFEALTKLILEEIEGPPTFFALDHLCDHFSLPTPKRDAVILRLKEMGFFASKTHFTPTGIRTDAPTRVVVEVLEELTRRRSP